MSSTVSPMKFAITLRAAGFALWLGLAATAQATPDAQAILAASDAIRNPARPFAVTASGQYRSLIRFVAPERDANKLMLKNGNDLWFYDPSSQASIRLSPQQRLLGQASNGDVVTVNLAKDYKAELLGEEDTADGERVVRRSYKLGLSAVSPDVTYHRVEMWVDAANSRPMKARFYSESGHLLKTAYYRKYQPQLGRERPTEVVIIDGLDPAWVTVLRYSDYAWRDVPDAWLQRDYLPRFKPG
jgi:Outer membrane lipoprotein-sorting protein